MTGSGAADAATPPASSSGPEPDQSTEKRRWRIPKRIDVGRPADQRVQDETDDTGDDQCGLSVESYRVRQQETDESETPTEDARVDRHVEQVAERLPACQRATPCDPRAEVRRDDEGDDRRVASEGVGDHVEEYVEDHTPPTTCRRQECSATGCD